MYTVRITRWGSNDGKPAGILKEFDVEDIEYSELLFLNIQEQVNILAKRNQYLEENNAKLLKELNRKRKNEYSRIIKEVQKLVNDYDFVEQECSEDVEEI